jgi:hypothetical protein
LIFVWFWNSIIGDVMTNPNPKYDLEERTYEFARDTLSRNCPEPFVIAKMASSWFVHLSFDAGVF